MCVPFHFLELLKCDLFPRYSRIVHRLLAPESDEREDAELLLGVLTCAKRPLKWTEIQGAVSIDPDNDTEPFNYEERRLCLGSKDLCGSLVEIKAGGGVEFVHITAKQ